MRPKINYPLGKSSPDYEFNGLLYDLKTLKPDAGSNTIFNRVKKSKKQTDRFIIDVTKTSLSDKIIEEQIEKVFTDKESEFVKELVIIKNNKIYKVCQKR